jgi:hypothetical protein
LAGAGADGGDRTAAGAVESAAADIRSAGAAVVDGADVADLASLERLRDAT